MMLLGLEDRIGGAAGERDQTPLAEFVHRLQLRLGGG
jgi:hypothetical protein